MSNKVNKNTLKKMLREKPAIIEHCYTVTDYHNNNFQKADIVDKIPEEFFKRFCFANNYDGIIYLNSYTDWYKIRF